MNKKIYHVPKVDIMHLFMQDIMSIDPPSKATGGLAGPGSSSGSGSAPAHRTAVF